jgi:hypothetical protein
VPDNPAPEALRDGLEEFARYRHERLAGDEKGEAQVFLDRLFRALGHGGVFEAGATLEMRVRRRDRGGTAFADLVWKPRVLVEMKKANEDLSRHYRQAFEYWVGLVPDRPQYVVLCNFDEFWLYDLDYQLEEPIDKVSIDDLARRWEAFAFLLPEPREPVFDNDLVAVTRESAALVSAVFNNLVRRGVERPRAQRFILQALMAMFSEDIGLLPAHYLTRAVDEAIDGASAHDLVFGLFREMNTAGETSAGRYQGTPYFNGGLFREIEPVELDRFELELLRKACKENWSEVRPAIFGTLFEQSLEMAERHAYGAHFTSEADIQKVVLPTIVRPWRERIDAASTLEELGQVERDLLEYRVLDPACGCGNFLYVAYRELRRLERQLAEKAQERRRARGAERELRMAFVSTHQFFGMDINAFAVEVAKVTLMLARKLAADELGDERAVLPLDDLDDNFQTADAVFADWPAFDACIGNPPYLGRRRIVEERGATYAARLAREYPDVGGVSDYVVYFFRKTHDLLATGARAGLVGTNTVRQGDTRRHSLDYIIDNGGVIYDAISSQPWSGDATVEVSIVNWTKGVGVEPRVLWLSNGTVKLEVPEITGALSADIDLRAARPIESVRAPKTGFQGQTPGITEAFVLDVETAERLAAHDPSSAKVMHPYLIGDELGEDGQPRRYIIDIDGEDAMSARALAPAAYDRLRELALPVRQDKARQEAARNAEVLAENPAARVNWHHRNFLERWWQLAYRRADMVKAIEALPRYIALSRVAVENRQSVYSFVSPRIRPGDAVQVFAFDDDYSFGILHSSIHRLWFERRCSTMRVDLRYTSRTVWDTFPWPQAPTDEHVGTVVAVVERLLAFREERLAAGIDFGAQYSSLRDPGRNPLRDLHAQLDEAVMALYGFTNDDDLLAQVLALNESIAEEEALGTTQPRGPGDTGLADTKRTTSMIEPELEL